MSSRRNFLKAATAMAIMPLAKASPAQTTETLHESQKIYESKAGAQYHLSASMKDVNFLGYKAIASGDVSLQASPFTFAMPQYIRALSPHNMAKDLIFTSERTERGAKFGMRMEDHADNVQILQSVQNVIAEVTKDGPLGRMDQIKFLALGFRDVDYTPDTGYIPDTAQTMTQLLKTSKGDCEDFAVARYTLGRMIGIPADHMAIICVGSGKKQIGEDLKTYKPAVNDHVFLAVYHDTEKEWFVIDATGRDAKTQKMGETLAYTNTEDNYNQFLSKMWPGLVPIIGVNEHGWFAFDSITPASQEFQATRSYVAKPRTPVPFNGKPNLILQDAAIPVDPTPAVAPSGPTIQP